ncbi:MAG: GFA family protein [Gallionella sp.]
MNAEPRAVVNCHCDFCRKHNGAAFSTYAVVAESALEITCGQDFLAVFGWSENGYKHFCRQCGTPLYSKNAKYPGLCMVQLGVIDAQHDLTPTANIYCESRLAWTSDISQIRSFEQGITRSA